MGERADWIASGLTDLVAARRIGLRPERGGYERMLALMRSPTALRQLAEAYTDARSSQGRTNPLNMLDDALRQAMEQERVPDIVAVMLARAHLTEALRIATPLTSLRAGDEQGAAALAATHDRGRELLWRLLLAWELAEDENLGAARSMLQPVVSGGRAVLPARVGSRVVTLLRHTLDVDDSVLNVLDRLDDNDLGELCRGLVEDDRLDEARRVAGAFRIFRKEHINALTAVARAALAAGRQELAEDALRHAVELVPDLRPDERCEGLARIAGVQARFGDIGTAAATFARAAEHAGQLNDPQSGLRTIAIEQANAGLPARAAATLAAISASGFVFAEEAAGAVAEAFARAGQLDQAEAALGRIGTDDIVGHRRKAVRELAVATAASGGPDRAVDLVDALLRPDHRDRVYAALVPALAGNGMVEAARRAYDRISTPSWQATALLDAASTADGTPITSVSLVELIAEVADPSHGALLLADYARTRDSEEADRLYAASLERASIVDRDDRWPIFAALGARVADRDPARAAGMFTVARRLLIEDTEDPWDDGRDLWELGRVQAESGDTAGARDTFALVVRGSATGPGQHLKAMCLVGIAAAQARSNDVAGARRTVELATEATRRLDPSVRAYIEPLVATAHLEAGDVDTSIRLVHALLRRARQRDGEPLDAANGAVEAACQIGPWLAKAGERSKARELLTMVSRKVSAFLAAHVGGVDALEQLAQCQAELGDVDGAMETAEHLMSRGPVLAACVAAAARDGEIHIATELAGRIGESRWRAQAYRELAVVLVTRADPAAASTFDEAVASAEYAHDPAETVAVLADIAEAQHTAGHTGAARDTLIRARMRAAAIELDPSRDEAWTKIARLQAAHGDFDAAISTAGEIGVAWLAGEAAFWIAVCLAAADGGLLDRAAALVETIDTEVLHWRAAGLHVIDVARQARDEVPPSSGLEVQSLRQQIPEGEPRNRLLELLAEAALTVGHYERAANYIQAIGRPEPLIQLADNLLSREAYDQVIRLIPACAKFPETAYMICPMLARIYPDSAAAISAEITSARVESDASSDESAGDTWDEEAWDDDLWDEDDGAVTAGVEWARPPPPSWSIPDAFYDAPLSSVVEDAMRDATSRWSHGELIDTRDILQALRRADSVRDWSRISLHFRDEASAAQVFVADPDHEPGGQWHGAILTGTCARALATAARIAAAYDLEPVPLGVLALALVADPRSAAAQCMGVVDETGHRTLINLIQEDVLGAQLPNLDP